MKTFLKKLSNKQDLTFEESKTAFEILMNGKASDDEIFTHFNHFSKLYGVKFRIEKYSHVMHIVSNVEGQFDNKNSLLDTMLAGFPAGTVTGAPKIRAMEIIDELEKSKRKMYAGSIGYFSANKNFDTCIALRTALIKDNKFYIQSGAGIVADSIPEKEYLETVHKAKALISSLR